MSLQSFKITSIILWIAMPLGFASFAAYFLWMAVTSTHGDRREWLVSAFFAAVLASVCFFAFRSMVKWAKGS
jgi:hypothetical protein